MILAPKNGKFIKLLCIESFEFVDDVWGNCSIVKDEMYDILPDSTNDELGYVFVRFRGGLCPHDAKYFKSLSEMRDDKLNEIL